MNKNLQQMRLILHFNIDKTIVMRNSLDYNNTDYCVRNITFIFTTTSQMREILSESIWGKIEYKNNEPVFKVTYGELEYERKNIPDQDEELMNYNQFLDWKFKLKTREEVENDDDRYMFNEDLM